MSSPAAAGLAGLAPGFADPVHDAQQVFRALLDAMSRPGRVHDVGPRTAPPGLSPAAAAVLLTVADPDVAVWFAPSPHAEGLAQWLRFHTGARLATGPDTADWLVTTAAEAEAHTWTTARDGSDEAPHTSATLLVELPSLAEGPGLRLAGPGIADTHALAAPGLPRPFWQARIEREALFPRGADLVLTSGTRLAAVPRSTRIALEN